MMDCLINWLKWLGVMMRVVLHTIYKYLAAVLYGFGKVS